MRLFLRSVFTGLVLLGGAALLHAEDKAKESDKKPDSAERSPERRFDPMEMFNKMDKNSDGKVEVSEIPEDHRERFEHMLKQAVFNLDESFTADKMGCIRAGGNEQVIGRGHGHAVECAILRALNDQPHPASAINRDIFDDEIF